MQAVIRAHRSWVKGAITRNDVCVALWDGIEIFESAFNTVRAFDLEREREERERKDAAPSGGPPFHAPPRPHRRRR